MTLFGAGNGRMAIHTVNAERLQYDFTGRTDYGRKREYAGRSRSGRDLF